MKNSEESRIRGNISTSGSVQISNNMQVSIDDTSDKGEGFFINSSLNINFVNYYLKVYNGSKLLIKKESKLY